MEEQSNMNLIDRYIYDVCRRLPKNQREDIERELRTLVADMLEEEGGRAEEILKKLGPPAKLARQYRDERDYIIGPEYCDTYRLVLKIVLICNIAGMGISFLVKALTEGDGARGLIFMFTDQLPDGIAGMIFSLIAAFGFVTLIFVLLERFKVHVDLDSGKEWAPSSLPEIPQKAAVIKRGESVTGIVFILIFCGILIFAPRLFGAWVEVDGQLQSIPLFNLSIWHITMPIFLVIAALGLIDEVVKLVMGRHCPAVAISAAITGILNVLLCGILMKALPLWNKSFVEDLGRAMNRSFDSSGDILRYWNSGLITDLILAGIIIATCIEIGVAVYKSIRYS